MVITGMPFPLPIYRRPGESSGLRLRSVTAYRVREGSSDRSKRVLESLLEVVVISQVKLGFHQEETEREEQRAQGDM